MRQTVAKDLRNLALLNAGTRNPRKVYRKLKKQYMKNKREGGKR
jgi:hypothetical protein